MDPWERRGPVRLSWSPARARGGGFGEIGLCKSRLGEIIPVKSLATLCLSFVGKGKKIGDSLQKCRKRKDHRIRTQPALDTQTQKPFSKIVTLNGPWRVGIGLRPLAVWRGTIAAPRQACTAVSNAQSQRERSAGRGAALHKRHNVTQLGLTSKALQLRAGSPLLLCVASGLPFPLFLQQSVAPAGRIDDVRSRAYSFVSACQKPPSIWPKR